MSLVLCAGMMGCFGGPPYRGPVSDHFDGERFVNRDGVRSSGFLRFMEWQRLRQRVEWPDWVESTPGPPPPRRVEGDALRVTVVNHATALIQTAGLNILTDPIWSHRCSPVSWVGPARVRAPGIRFDDLPPIDVVLISHNHYDHLDVPTLRRLVERDRPRIYAGLGTGALFEAEGIDGGVDLDWWQSVALGAGVKLWAVPAAHFSGRGLEDRDTVLWGGFVVQGPGGPVYFAGDTGWGSHYAEIRRRFGPIRLALLPIGAYRPQWFMRPVHISPAEAVAAHRVLEAGLSVGIHFGTFPLADEGIDEPVYDLGLARSAAGVEPAAFVAPVFGRGIEVAPRPATRPSTRRSRSDSRAPGRPDRRGGRG